MERWLKVMGSEEFEDPEKLKIVVQKLNEEYREDAPTPADEAGTDPSSSSVARELPRATWTTPRGEHGSFAEDFLQELQKFCNLHKPLSQVILSFCSRNQAGVVRAPFP